MLRPDQSSTTQSQKVDAIPSQVYDRTFFENQRVGSRRSASIIVPLVISLLQPKSVLDVGCGVGTWLAEWIANGVTDVAGVDGDYVEQSTLQIPVARFQCLNLEHAFSLGRRFDLVQSLEVAEHLTETCADAFVESLCGHADSVLFSAAVPGQGGANHVNEQWPSYWVEKFSRAGFNVFDIIRPAIWNDPHIDVWYRQNTFLFSKNTAGNESDTHLDTIHPELWNERNSAYLEWSKRRYDDLTVRQLIKLLPSATTNAYRHYRAKFR